jgi:hypothetical protein
MDFTSHSLGFGGFSGERLVLSGEKIADADFGGREIAQFSSDGCVFTRCSFNAATISSASFGAGRRNSEYVDCNFDRADLSMGPGGYARFVNCTFTDATIRNWFCFAVELIDCTFTGKLRRTVFNGSVPPDQQVFAGRTMNRIEGNDFSGADFVDVSFRTGVDLTRQALPKRPGYLWIPDAASSLARARSRTLAWRNRELTADVEGVLQVLEDDVSRGQRQLLVRLADYPHAARRDIETLLSD